MGRMTEVCEPGRQRVWRCFCRMGGGGNFIKLSLQYFHSWRGWVRLEEGGMWNQNKVRNVTEVVG